MTWSKCQVIGEFHELQLPRNKITLTYCDLSVALNELVRQVLNLTTDYILNHTRHIFIAVIPF